MKKAKQKTKKKKDHKEKNLTPQIDDVADSNVKTTQKKQAVQKPVRTVRKKAPEKKGAGDGAVSGQITKARQFLRESKIELKKVKWPTKKELLASTAVVIFLSLLMAFYFWLVDWGLMAIIKNILA